jgi:hypothetical protein
VAVLLACAVAGCGAEETRRGAGDLRAALPVELAERLPPGLEVCFDEASDHPAAYRLWLVRAPGHQWLEPPRTLGAGHPHELPERILRGMFAAKAPGIDLGAPRHPRGRSTHWKLGEAEVQIREIVTENGWFASVETFQPGRDPGP